MAANGCVKRVLVTGARGFLGSHVMARLASSAHRTASIPGRDVTEAAVAEIAPDVVVHLGALTNADTCEAEPELARDANVTLTRRIAESARASCRRFVYASTDLVFDGEQGRYAEDDAPRPICVYGESKLEGERVAREVLGDRVLVLRLALMYGPRRDTNARSSFAETMIRRARRGEHVSLFVDQYRSPLYVEDASESIVRLVEAPAPTAPVIHLGGPERHSRYEMGKIAFDVLGIAGELARPSRMADYAGAPRPDDVSFDTALARSLALPSRSFREGVLGFHDRM